MADKNVPDPVPDPVFGVYDHASTDDAEAANADNTKKWVAAQKAAGKRGSK